MSPERLASLIGWAYDDMCHLKVCFFQRFTNCNSVCSPMLRILPKVDRPRPLVYLQIFLERWERMIVYRSEHADLIRFQIHGFTQQDSFAICVVFTCPLKSPAWTEESHNSCTWAIVYNVSFHMSYQIVCLNRRKMQWLHLCDFLNCCWPEHSSHIHISRFKNQFLGRRQVALQRAPRSLLL